MEDTSIEAYEVKIVETGEHKKLKRANLTGGKANNGALSMLSLKKNNLCNRKAGKALSEMLAANTVLKELDVSENTYDRCDSVGFSQELAVGISDNGTSSSLTFSGSHTGRAAITLQML
jgi:hypothetical protein